MAERDENGKVLLVKIVLAGVPGSGKAAILRQMADRYAHGSQRVGYAAGGEVFRTDFFWPEVLADGRRLRVRLFAVSGCPAYNAVDELVLGGCDGVVFVTGVSPGSLEKGRDALRTLVFNAGRNGYELASRPIVFQYTRVDEVPGFRPEPVDEWLGIPPGSVARFVSGSHGGDDLCRAVEWAIGWVIHENSPLEVPAMS